MKTRPLVTPSMRRVLATASPAGVVRNVPIPMAIAMIKRGWGERHGNSQHYTATSHPTTEFHLNSDGRRVAHKVQEGLKYAASYDSTLATISKLLEDTSLDQLIRNAEVLVERLTSAGCDSGSARGYLAALNEYRLKLDQAPV